MAFRKVVGTAALLRASRTHATTIGSSNRRYLSSSSSSQGEFNHVAQIPSSTQYIGRVASASPFTEPTSPNPSVTLHAEATQSLHYYGSYLMQCLPKFIQQFSVLKDELTLYICPSGVVPVLTFLRDHSQCQFKTVVDVTAVDFPEKDKRFEVIYHLLSYKYAGRIRVKTYAGEADAVPSASSVFRGADW